MTRSPVNLTRSPTFQKKMKIGQAVIASNVLIKKPTLFYSTLNPDNDGLLKGRTGRALTG